MTVALQGISGRGAKRDLNPPGGKPRSQHLTAVGASLLARSVGGQRRSPNQPVPTGGTPLLRPDDVDRKQLRACHSPARSPLSARPRAIPISSIGTPKPDMAFGSVRATLVPSITTPNISNEDEACERGHRPNRGLFRPTRLEKVTKPGAKAAN